jgi:CDP-6-deoxy-D-xylo-4-hexulose-3-dehydrase
MKYRIFDELKNTDLVMNLFWIGVYHGLTEEKLEYMLKIFNKFFNKL